MYDIVFQPLYKTLLANPAMIWMIIKAREKNTYRNEYFDEEAGY